MICAEQENSKRPARQVLIELRSLVIANKGFEAPKLNRRQQLPVLGAL